MDPEGNHAFDGEEPSQERDTSAGTFTSHGIPGESLAARGPRDTESETYKNTKSLLSRDDSSRRDNDDDTDLAVPSIGTAVGTSRSLSSDELPKPQTPVRPQHPSSLIRHEVEVLESRWWGLYNALPKMAAEFNYHFTVEQYWARKRFDDGIRGSRHKILTSPHRLLPTTTTHLVRIQASNDPAIESETRICVAGLGQKKEILDFHAYWRRRYNKHWLQYPNKKSTLLKLCYSPVRVQAAALATCEAKVMSDKTLCGSLIVVRSSKSSQRTSTIGGLMKVNGKFFATTTRHLPEDSEQDMEVHNYGAKLQPDSLLIPNDDASETEWQELCESYRLLIVEEDQSKEEGYGEEQDDGDVNRLAHSHIADEDNQDSGPQEAEELDQSQSADTSPGEEGYFSFRIDEDELLVGRDWQLVPIHSGGLLPNEIPEQRDGPAWARSNPFIEHICKDLRKMFKRDPGSPRKTWVISGMGGLKNCVMCPNPSSMISTDGTVQEIWTIGFDHQGLEAGDSGSWVVDPAHAQLLGMVVARSPGIGYVVPFTSVQQDIAKTMGVSLESVKLPSRHEEALRRSPNDSGEGNIIPNARFSLKRYLYFIVPLAIGYMALLLVHGFDLEDGPLSFPLVQILGFPVLALVFWAACEAYFTYRPTRLDRQRLQRYLRRLFFKLFLITLIAAYLGVHGAHLWRTLSFSKPSLPTNPDGKPPHTTTLITKETHTTIWVTKAPHTIIGDPTEPYTTISTPKEPHTTSSDPKEPQSTHENAKGQYGDVIEVLKRTAKGLINIHLLAQMIRDASEAVPLEHSIRDMYRKAVSRIQEFLDDIRRRIRRAVGVLDDLVDIPILGI